MAKNKLSDLNDHLFAQLERLGDETLTAEQISQEAERAEAIVALADRIVDNADLQLRAAKLWGEYGAQIMPMLPQIGNGSAKGGTE
jgi:hypothetical protein